MPVRPAHWEVVLGHARSMNTKLTTDKQRVLAAGLLFVVFTIGLGLRLYELGEDSLWSDEIVTARTSQLSIPSILRHQSEKALNPPLTFIVTHFFFAWGGESDFVARLPAALLGSLSILLIYGVGEMLWTRSEGIIAAFLLAVSAHHVEYSQEARQYALMLFLALLSVLFLLKALQKNEMRLWMGFLLCTSLSLYNHYFAFLLIPAELIFGAWVIAEKWLSYRKDSAHTPQIGAPAALSSPAKQALFFSLSLILVGVSYLPWVSTLEAQISQQAQSGTVGIPTTSLQSSLSLLSQVPAAYGGGGGIPVLLWLAVLLLGLTACDRKQIALTLLWMGAPFAFLAVVGVKHSINLRYLLFTLPAYLLLAARGITCTIPLVDRLLQRTQRGRTWPVTVVPVLCVLILGAASALSVRTYYLTQKEDWRGAARHLADHMAPEDIIVADGIRYGGGGDARRVSEGLSYYLTSYGAATTSLLPVEQQLWQGLQRPRPWDGDVWGVLWGPGDLPPADMVTVVDLHKVSIIRLRQPSGDAVQDTLSMLQALLVLLPPEAHFDVHLALEEIYLRTGRCQQAASELDAATQVKPDYQEASQVLADARAEWDELSCSTENIHHPLRRNLGDVVAFLGYDMHPAGVQAGATLDVTLWWQALGDMDKDYTVFIHIVDRDGHIWAQEDRVLQHGDYPTSTWLVGETVTDEYELALAPDTPPGDYIVKAGIYYWQTGERLPVWDENGERVEGDAVFLETIVVSQ